MSGPDTSASEEDWIKVEVAYARPDEQAIIPVTIAVGASARDAVEESGIQDKFPEIEIERNDLGIFGKQIKPEQVLRPGDRVEIYRPLVADPKEVRRQLAKVGKTMGKKK